MTEFKGTPGPWEWWTSCSWKRLTAKDESGRWMKEGNVICPSIDSDGHPNLSVSNEDMALIAAAPDLLECLIELRQWISQEIAHPNSPCGRADTAIAKALGEDK